MKFKNLLKAVLISLVMLPGIVSAQMSVEDLYDYIDTHLPSASKITAAEMRDVLKKMVESAVNADDVGIVLVEFSNDAVVWQAELLADDIYMRVSPDNGITWSGPINMFAYDGYEKLVTDTLIVGGDTVVGVAKGVSDNHIIPSKGYVDSLVIATGGYTDESARDAIGAALKSTGDVTFVYSDAGDSITGTVKDDSHNHIIANIDNLTDTLLALHTKIAGKQPTLTTGNLTEAITGLQYSATRQVIGGAAELQLTSGYSIPTTASITRAGNHVANDQDTLSTNEIQDLSLSGSTLSLTGDATTVNLNNWLNSANVVMVGTTQTISGLKTFSNTETVFGNTSAQAAGIKVYGLTYPTISFFNSTNGKNLYRLNDDLYWDFTGSAKKLYHAGNANLGTVAWNASAYSINGTSINTTGTLTNVAYKGQNNNFTTSQTITGTLTAQTARFTTLGTGEVVSMLGVTSNGTLSTNVVIDTSDVVGLAEFIGNNVGDIVESDPVYLGSSWYTTTNNATNWNTAYTDRNKWDGGATGLTAATGRTSLGGTTIGQSMFTLSNPSAITFPRFNADNTVTALTASTFRTAIGGSTAGQALFTLTNPSAISFLRMNADNSVSALSASDFRTAIGAGTSSTTGTVTSVAMTVPTGLTVSGTPITTNGTLSVSLQSGYSIPATATQSNWTAGYDDKITSLAVTGTSTKTITLTQQDGGTVTGTFTDIDTDTQLSEAQVDSYVSNNGYVTGTPWTSQGYLTSETSHADVVVDGDFTSNGLMKRTGAGTYSIVTDNSTNWNIAADERLRWDGGATGLTAATGRTSLGGTTIGQSMFTLSNPSAITFPRFNADNTVTALTASTFRTAIGGSTAGQALFTLTNPSAISFLRVNADNSVSALNATDFRTAIGAGVGNMLKSTYDGNQDNKIDLEAGGTGVTAFDSYELLIGSTGNYIDQVSGVGTSGQVLTSNGAGTKPTWQTNMTQWTADADGIYYNSGKVALGTGITQSNSSYDLRVGSGGIITTNKVVASGGEIQAQYLFSFNEYATSPATAATGGYFFVRTDNKPYFKSDNSSGNVIYDLTKAYSLEVGTPASSTATGTAGQVKYDANYIYICTATNTWKRIALESW